MSKVTIGVYKAYKNSGNLRFHKRNAKKHWKHYFIEQDDYDEDEREFGSEWVSSFKAIILKRKQLYKKKFVCLECGYVSSYYVAKNTKVLMDLECPNCND